MPVWLSVMTRNVTFSVYAVCLKIKFTHYTNTISYFVFVHKARGTRFWPWNDFKFHEKFTKCSSSKSIRNSICFKKISVKQKSNYTVSVIERARCNCLVAQRCLKINAHRLWANILWSSHNIYPKYSCIILLLSLTEGVIYNGKVSHEFIWNNQNPDI